MSIETMDIEQFLETGGLFIVVLIAGILMVLITVFTYLMWDKDDKSYLLKFLSYLFATLGVLLGAGMTSGILIGLSEATAIYVAGMLLFILPVLASIGIRTYLFIRDKWLSKEDKV